jgi:hypothetical protein
MSIIPKLLTLGLAAVLSSPVPQHQIDFSMPGPDGQRIDQLWLATLPAYRDTSHRVQQNERLAILIACGIQELFVLRRKLIEHHDGRRWLSPGSAP